MKKTIVLLALAMFMLPAIAFAEIGVSVGAESNFVLGQRFDMQNLNRKANYIGQDYDLVANIKAGPINIKPKAGISVGSYEMNNLTLNTGIGWNVGIDAYADIPIDIDIPQNPIPMFKRVIITPAIGYGFSRKDINEVVMGSTTIDNPVETIDYNNSWEAKLLVGPEFVVDKTDSMPKIVLTPYVGPAYSDSRGTIDANLPFIDMKEKVKARQNWGIRYGGKLQIGDNFSARIDACAIDKIGFTVSGLYQF